jgi:hypothetical protein
MPDAISAATITKTTTTDDTATAAFLRDLDVTG